MPDAGSRPADTRERILSAAAEQFAEHGFDGASLRSIAGAAGVDAALIHHYFGTKQRLFLTVVRAPADPSLLIDAVLEHPVDELGTALARTLVTLWDSPGGAALAALLRSAVADERRARWVQEFVLPRIAGRVVRHAAAQTPSPDGAAVGAKELRWRQAQVAAALLGAVMSRYILRVEPLASADPDTVADWLGPVIQRTLMPPPPEPVPPPDPPVPDPVSAARRRPPRRDQPAGRPAGGR